MGKKVALVVGVFDLFHRGHVELLDKAKKISDRLYVLVNGDDFTAIYKRRPIYSENDRLSIVLSNKNVDFAEIAYDGNLKPYIEKFEINLIIHGDDWEHNSYLRQIGVDDSYVKERNISFVYTEYFSGVSTSEIIKKIKSI